MKITQVISDSNVGGAGVLLSSVCGSLANDFEFEIIIPRGSSLKERLPEKIKITELPITADISFCKSDVGVFLNHFKNHRPDIIHSHASLSSRIAGKIIGAHSCISTRHCAKPEEKIKKLGFLKRNIYNYCTDMTISTADFATENLVKEGVSRSKIVTIKNGSRCPEGLTESEKTKLCKELNINSDALIIGSSARLEEVKGQDLILRAAPGIIKSFSSAVFLFLGDGSRRDEYMRLSASLGIEKNVRFIGYVENPAPYQNLFYVNVNSSRGTETSCLAISECMALGIPTVASSFGGNTEMIKDGECGLIFPTDNHFELQRAICRLLSDGELHKKLSFGARRRYEDLYSTERMANDYKKLYLSLGGLRDKNTVRPKKQVKNASL